MYVLRKLDWEDSKGAVNNPQFSVWKFQLTLYKSFIRLAVDVQALAAGSKTVPRRARLGRLLPDACVQFDKAENSSLNIVGKAKG